MQSLNNSIQLIGIPFTALLSVVFGLLLVSFPVGIYVVFESEIGGDINYEYPFTDLHLFNDTILQQIPINVSVGDAFVVLWMFYLVVFVIAVLGPRQRFLKTLSGIISRGEQQQSHVQLNYMVGVTKWLSILVLISAIIDLVQTSLLGIEIIPPLPLADAENHLIQFFYISLAPLIEEFGFRLLLIGIPLFLIYSKKASIKYFIRCLWNPHILNIDNSKKAIILIVVVGVVFGMSHIIFEGSWSEGKFAQATAGGIILGWAYLRYGFVAALLIHWATNYFVFSYGYFIAEINAISIDEVFSHSFMATIEIILLASGIFSISVLIINKFLYGKSIKGLKQP